MLDEWLGDLRAVRGLRRSTLRGYQEAIRMLCLYLTDPAYGWAGECETRFGTHPVQVVHEWNTAVHVQQAEGDPIKRAFTIDELQAFFDHADGEVARIRAAGRKAGYRRSATPPCSRSPTGTGCDATKPACSMSPTSAPTHTPEFGEHGVCYVRHGKAMKGSAPKRRSVLTVWPWVGEALTEWTTQIRPLLAANSSPASTALWPSERAPRIGLAQIDARFAALRLFPGRRPGQPLSYVTLSQGLRDLGVPLRLARVAAIRQLALQAPAPVIAEALGFHHTTTHRQTIHAAGIWNRYAAPDPPAEPRTRGR
jgi:hypothetical protein